MSYKISCSHLADAVNIPLNAINSKEVKTCADCDCTGPNLWICLHRYCLRIGCSDNFNDHSTLHYTVYPNHCVHMNLSTQRIWCYKCEMEVFLEPLKTQQPMDTCNGAISQHDSDREDQAACTTKSIDSGHCSYGTVQTPSPVRGNIYAFEKNVGLNVGMNGDSTDYSDSEDGADINLDRPAGLVGLQNIGNTCYMNAALQALSNAVPLRRFFLDCSAVVHILSEGKKPELSRTYQTLMRDIWLKPNNGYVTPSGILYGIRSVHAMFRGYHQHDTQEFLRNFMDQLHEELKQLCPPETSAADSDTFAMAMEEPGATIGGGGSSSPPSYDSSEGEYETCDSGVSERSSLSDDTERPSSSNNTKRRLSRSTSPGRRLKARLHSATVIDCQPSTSSTPNIASPKKQPKYRSIISDIFDGKLLSSVQCLTCNRVSSRIETFQDLSLPIPSRDHLMVLHGRVPIPTSTCSDAVIPVQDGWIAWIFNWFKSWFYGPIVTLPDCLAAFFSTDELKGDNMYSCEKCNKLRNGIKFSKVLQLPEVLCIHLKRFRHELMFSSKISSAVSFPLKGLDMKPYLHNDCVSKVTSYDLFSVICHHGTAGGGHYISYALNSGQWYEFDDQYVTRVSPEKIESCEAYVLFYRKNTTSADSIRVKAIKTSEMFNDVENEVAYVSKQWITRFNTCAEPGPIDNSDFLCQHGSINPEREVCLNQITVVVPITVYEYLHKTFGGCPPVTCLHICPACQAFQKRLLLEWETFVQLSMDAQNHDCAPTHLLSLTWYKQWHSFVCKRSQESPGPIDNFKINTNQIDVNQCVEVPEEIWSLFYGIYGGGPEIRLEQEEEDEEKIHEEPTEDNVTFEFVPDFVIPKSKKQVEPEIDKNSYSHGEPMEITDCGNNSDKESEMIDKEVREEIAEQEIINSPSEVNNEVTSSSNLNNSFSSRSSKHSSSDVVDGDGVVECNNKKVNSNDNNNKKRRRRKIRSDCN